MGLVYLQNHNGIHFRVLMTIAVKSQVGGVDRGWAEALKDDEPLESVLDAFRSQDKRLKSLGEALRAAQNRSVDRQERALKND